MTAASSSEEKNYIDIIETKLVNLRVEDELVPSVGMIVKRNYASELLESDSHAAYVIDNIDAPSDDALGVPVSFKIIHRDAAPSPNLDDIQEAYSHTTGDNLEAVAEFIFEESDTEEGLTDEQAEAAIERLESAIKDVEESQDEDEPEETDMHKIWESYSNSGFVKDVCIETEFHTIIPEAYMNMAHQVYEVLEGQVDQNDLSLNENFLNRPSFVLIMEDEESEARQKDGYLLEHLIGQLEFYPYATPMYTNSTGELSNLFAGEYVVKPTHSQMGLAISNLLSFIVRIAEGDINALEELDDLSAPIVTVREKMEEGSKRKPLSEDAIIHTMVHTLSNLHEATSPETLFNLLHEKGVLAGYEDTIEMLQERAAKEESKLQLQEIFGENGLEDIFGDIDELPPLYLNIPENAAEGELTEFYSTPISANSLPKSMSDIADSIDMSVFAKYDFMDANGLEGVEFSVEESGELFKAFVIALAVRYSRMKQMVEYGLPFTPINVFFNTIETLYGSSFGESVITYGILNVTDDGREILSALITQGIPKSLEGRHKMLEILSQTNKNFPLLYITTAARIMHSLVHYIMNENLDPKAVADELGHNNVLKEFISTLIEDAENFKEEDEEEAEEGIDYDTCIPWDMAVSELISNEASPQEISDGIINIMNTLSMFNAPKHLTETELYAHHDKFYVTLAHMVQFRSM